MRAKGFTLVEVLVVMVILGILATIAIPTYRGYLRNSYRNEAKAHLENLVLLEKRYFALNNTYAFWSCQDNETPHKVFSDFPAGDLKFKYCIYRDRDIDNNSTAPTPCFHITATGKAGTPVEGEVFEIDCNQNRKGF